MKLDKPLNLNFDGSKHEATLAHQTQGQQGTLAEIPAAQQLDELRAQLQARNNLLDAKNQEISELKIKNRQLIEENRKTQDQQKFLEDELYKAETQIELITELMDGDQRETTRQ